MKCSYVILLHTTARVFKFRLCSKLMSFTNLLVLLSSMSVCRSTRGQNSWCSYSQRNGTWNCQNFWSPCRAARPTLICRPSWKRWVWKSFHNPKAKNWLSPRPVFVNQRVEMVGFCVCHLLIEWPSCGSWNWNWNWNWFLSDFNSQEIRKGLLKAAKTTGAWIFTGGTNTGEQAMRFI